MTITAQSVVDDFFNGMKAASDKYLPPLFSPLVDAAILKAKTDVDDAIPRVGAPTKAQLHVLVQRASTAATTAIQKHISPFLAPLATLAVTDALAVAEEALDAALDAALPSPAPSNPVQTS